MNATDRVRFAPSPTGYLHVGSARTALFNWIYARGHDAQFVVRIEDTDTQRNQNDLIDIIFEELAWLGIDFDGEPSFQSRHADRHRDVVQEMIVTGQAYCVDDDNNPVGEPDEGIIDEHAVRFRVPKGQDLSFDDAVRGTVSFRTDDLEDFVIWRSNGTATFLLANAVDDADMGITHAIRGEDLLNTVPKVILLLDAMGAPHPTYAHLPLLVNEQRKKLSKRRDDVSIAEYRTRGYLPQAMTNYLALLGWGPSDDVEIRPIEEIIDRFELDDVNKAPAFFDLKKLNHFNAAYIQALSPGEFVETAMPFVTGDADVPWNADAFDAETLLAVAPDVQQRITVLSEIPDWVDWLFVDEISYDDKAWTKAMTKPDQHVAAVLDAVIARLEAVTWQAEDLQEAVRLVGDELGAKSQIPVRVALTGKLAGIPLWEGMVRLGRENTLARLRNAKERLSDPKIASN